MRTVQTSHWLMAVVCVLLSGCGDPIGAPCRFQGSGFTASDNCRYRCLDTRNIRCPDDTDIRPQICSGAPGCQPGTCGADEVCYHVADPFQAESYCVPREVCGAVEPDTLSEWSKQSMQRAAALRAEYEARKARREGLPTKPSPAVDHD